MISKTIETGKRIAPKAQILAFNPTILPGLGNFGGWTLQLQDMDNCTDEELHEISNKVVSEMNANPKIRGARSNFRIDSQNYNFEINRDKANALGLDFADIFTAIRVNYGGHPV